MNISTKQNIITLVGATGVLGRNLVPLLLKKGYMVRVLARSVPKAAALFGNGVDIRQFDLLNAEDQGHLPALLEGSMCVAHIATSIPKDMGAPGAWDANTRLRTEGTPVLLRAALEAGVRSYLQQSITMAYIDHGDEWIDENTPLDASGDVPYALPVISMEAAVKTIGDDHIRWCILRGGSFIGPGTGEEDILELLRAGTQVIPGDGSSYASFIHVADIASAFVSVIERNPHRAVYNIVDTPVRYGEYLSRLAASHGLPPPPADPRQPNPRSFRCSNERARRELGWTPEHSIVSVL